LMQKKRRRKREGRPLRQFLVFNTITWQSTPLLTKLYISPLITINW
jgi:hypothetical protein